MNAPKFKTRGIKNEFLPTYTNDNVHGSIKICPLAKELIDTRHVQRLRELKQLGVSDLTYINATHTRFEHSLGVMYLAEKMLLNLIDKRQAVEISPKDVLCVKIAGLLHDIGHGPYSHVYDGLFRTQLGRAEARGSWMGHAFERGSSSDEVTEGWAHEDASLMMIDSMLEDLGMQIDETNLDKPLRQIGDGIDARRFGVGECWVDGDDGISDRSDEEDEERHDGPALSKDEVMTSRDWIFIKECVVGGPLPPRGVSIHEFKRSAAGRRAQFIGRDPHLKEFHLKEFLYDVVSNRHSGLDVDKIDYLARDTLKAHGSNCIADLMPKLIEKAFVAWGEPCEDGGEKHLMICYPEYTVPNAMSFFEQRYKEHQRLFHHPKTSRFNYMMCDIFLLAEPYFRIRAADDDQRASPMLPISRCMMNAEAYLLLTDGVIDKIENTDDVELRPARDLIRKYRHHKKYARVGLQVISKDKPWTEKLWEMDESEIIHGILKINEMVMRFGDSLHEDDIIVEKNQVHHGMKDKNPVDYMRFLSTKKCDRQLRCENLPTAKRISGYRKPDIFQQNSVRVFCRSFDGHKRHQLKASYETFVSELVNDHQYPRVEFEEYEEYDRSSNSTPEVTGKLPTVTQTPEKYKSEECEHEYNKRQRYKR